MIFLVYSIGPVATRVILGQCFPDFLYGPRIFPAQSSNDLVVWNRFEIQDFCGKYSMFGLPKFTVASWILGLWLRAREILVYQKVRRKTFTPQYANIPFTSRAPPVIGRRITGQGRIQEEGSRATAFSQRHEFAFFVKKFMSFFVRSAALGYTLWGACYHHQQI